MKSLPMGIRLALGLSLCPLALYAQDQNTNTDGDPHTLDKVTVTATPLGTDALEMTQSASVLVGEELRKQVEDTIGDTVDSIPGVHSGTFGAGVGRPIIRGLDGARVDVLENNISSNDVSNVSADHAVSIEPFLADQIEVLRGPATLLYGSDTIGGVVNVRTNRIPVQPIEGLTGSVQLQGDTVADERFGGIRLDGGTATEEEGGWAFHIDAFARDTDDYEIPESAELEDDDHEEEEGHEDEHEEFTGKLENSATENSGGAVGATYFGDGWHLGFSFSTYDSKYGIPGGHAHEEEEDHEGEEEGEHEEEEEELISIDLESERFDMEFQADNPFSGWERFKLLLSRIDYEHVELEGDEIGTLFNNDTTEGRLEFTHNPVNGWRGVVGLQYSDRDFSAIGEEAFVPPTQTDTLAFFWLEEAEFGNWRVELGMRLEDQDIKLDDGRSVSHEPFSISAGAIWHIDDDSHVSFNLARAERAPAEEELFASGPHIATQTFEVGDSTLTEERSTNFEISYKKHMGPLTATVTAFRNDFSNFILLSDTGEMEDGLPVREWVQGGADFQGLEVELEYHIGNFDSGDWDFRLLADTVDASLSGGGNVPRTPPHRIALGLDWSKGNWSSSLDFTHYSNQDEVAAFETRTDGYSMVDFDLLYQLPGSGRTQWQLYLKGRNLTDEAARSHTSFLKDVVLLPGRNWIAGIRGTF